MTRLLPWAMALGLGAFHGLNPAMGWLFAVALGYQEGRRRAIFQAVGALVVGHCLAVGAAVVLFWAVGVWLPWHWVAMGAAVVLAGFGFYWLLRARHPRWVGMRVGFWELVLWAFLMASAHGAGLMLLPALGAAGLCGQGSERLAMAEALGVAAVHSVGYWVVALGISLFVFEKIGLSFLRKAWWNLDVLWGTALLLAAGTLLLFPWQAGP
ncbi:MAG: hypothetical protein PHO89_04590 [Methylacidiphilaceae bacterium]|nr:hypothetical protein [Candidatus Methylacidiphilaceae bacterium]